MADLFRAQASKSYNNIGMRLQDINFLGSDCSYFTKNTISSAVKPTFDSIQGASKNSGIKQIYRMFVT